MDRKHQKGKMGFKNEEIEKHENSKKKQMSRQKTEGGGTNYNRDK